MITVPAGEGIDSARATIRIEWPTPASDYDMRVYRDGVEVGTSGQGTPNLEQAVLGDPAPGEYVVRVSNWTAVEPWTGTVTFEGPEAFQPAHRGVDAVLRGPRWDDPLGPPGARGPRRAA